MPRAKAILQSEFPYNISARCINREWFNIPMEEVWDIFCDELNRTIQEHGLEVHSFILMSNHFHLIASTPRANISQCMHQFMMRSSRRLTRTGNRINQTFAGRHFKCILHEFNYYLNAYKYNYRNPITAGICSSVADYPFSTFQFLLKQRNLKFPLAEDTTFLSDPAGTLGWLNKEPEQAKLEAVRFALKRNYFTPKKCNVSNRPLMTLNDIL